MLLLLWAGVGINIVGVRAYALIDYSNVNATYDGFSLINPTGDSVAAITGADGSTTATTTTDGSLTTTTDARPTED